MGSHIRLKQLPEAMRKELMAARLKRGWSQAELGQRAGLPQMHISGIETGKIVPRVDTMLDLVRVLGDRDSGREKRVLLTTKGDQFLSSMAAEGRIFTQKLLDGMPQQEIQEMVRLMQKAIAVFEQDKAGNNSATSKSANRKPPKLTRHSSPHPAVQLRALAAGRS